MDWEQSKGHYVKGAVEKERLYYKDVCLYIHTSIHYIICMCMYVYMYMYISAFLDVRTHREACVRVCVKLKFLFVSFDYKMWIWITKRIQTSKDSELSEQLFLIAFLICVRAV